MTNLSTLFPAQTAADFYKPAMMEFDGSTGYYNKTYTASGNKVTTIVRFKIPAFVTATIPFMYLMHPVGALGDRCSLSLVATDRTPSDEAGKIRAIVGDSTGTELCRFFSESIVNDSEAHTIMWSYDADNGAGQLVVDGVVEDDTGVASRVAPTTGTLDTTATALYVGDVIGGIRKVAGELGFIGHDDQYLTNWSDFMDINGNLIKQDEATWANSGWGSQPLFWNEHGFMEDNKGSAGDMTENGTIVVAPAEVPA